MKSSAPTKTGHAKSDKEKYACKMKMHSVIREMKNRMIRWGAMIVVMTSSQDWAQQHARKNLGIARQTDMDSVSRQFWVEYYKQ